MTNELETLKNEIENFKKQNAQTSAGVQALLAQIDAHKQHLGETTQACLNLRTNVILLQKQNQELNGLLNEANQKLEAANKRIVELEPKLEPKSEPKK